MNCFTFEASFHGCLNEERQTEEFTPDSLEQMGDHLTNSLYEYFMILEEDERLKKIKELNKKKKKKQEVQSKKKKKPGKEPNVQQEPQKNQQSKKTSPRVNEQESEEVNQNPNEPPALSRVGSSSPRSLLNMKKITITAPNKHMVGIRSLKQMINQMKVDEKKQAELVEEGKGGLSDVEENDQEKESGSDSDPQDDELSVSLIQFLSLLGR